jgi:DNA-binding beta-propeller fold protein YncE
VSVVDGRSGKVKATVPVGMFPDAVAVSPLTGDAFVANANTNTVSVISRQNTVTAIETGVAPFGAAISPQTGLAWIANSVSNTLTAITSGN